MRPDPAPAPRALDRRRLLTASLALPAAGLAATAVGTAAAPAARAATGPILKALPADRFVVHGTNAEMRWGSVSASERLTAQADLFVRNHTRTPVLDAATWRLRLFGDGLAQARGEAEALSLGLADLRALPPAAVTTTHECTGNGRSFFGTQQGRPAPGTPWRLGSVGAVRWEGVLLRDLLRHVGLSPEAVSVMATGLDDPFTSGGTAYGRVRRPVPVAKALDDTLLAWAANGEELLPDHGHPVRLVVPGWVGIASIKWLGSLEVATRELTSPWNTTFYRLTGPGYPAGSPPLTANPVRSAFELDWDATLPAGRSLTLTGRAWSGTGPVERVEVSTDGGATWSDAVLRGPGGGGSTRDRKDTLWTRFRHEWRDPRPGRHLLLARATDAQGRTQPDATPWNEQGYFFDAVVRHPVTVV